MPSCPPLPETVEAAKPSLSLPGGQERAGNEFVSDASAMTPGPEPRE